MDVYSKLSEPAAFLIFLGTLLLPIGVGIWALRRTRNQSDFFLGGRAMSQFTVALSAVSSGRSSWLVLGVSGMAYKMGASAIWATVGYTAVEALQFIYVGRKLRVETQELGSITLLDYLESKFHDEKHLIRIIGAVIIGIFITAYVAAQFNAGAKTIGTALDLPIIVSLLCAGALVLVYMVLGGYVAVAYNDVIRAIIMLVGLIVLPVIAVVELGGWGAMSTVLTRLSPTHLDPMAIGFGALIRFHQTSAL